MVFRMRRGRAMPIRAPIGLLLAAFVLLAAGGVTTGRAVAQEIDQERRALEIRKLEAETRKLNFERRVGLLAPGLNALSILMLALALIVQRKTSNEIQSRQEKVNFDLKIAEF